jgi:hypothetical protein
MDRSDHYRAKAAQCMRMANESTSQDDKTQWIKLAADFLALIPQPAQPVAQQQQQIQPKPDNEK